MFRQLGSLLYLDRPSLAICSQFPFHPSIPSVLSPLLIFLGHLSAWITLLQSLNVFSIEWKRSCEASLLYDKDRREFRVESRFEEERTRIIAIRASQIDWCSATSLIVASGTGGVDSQIFFSLVYPPSFETRPNDHTHVGGLTGPFELLSLSPQNGRGTTPLRDRWPSFDDQHAASAAFTSLSIRLVCKQQSAPAAFRGMCKEACMRPSKFAYPVDHRALFSASRQEAYTQWAIRLPWPVAYQIEAIIRDRQVDFREILSLAVHVERLLASEGSDFTVSFLRHFATKRKELYWFSNTSDSQDSREAIEEFFKQCRAERPSGRCDDRYVGFT